MKQIKLQNSKEFAVVDDDNYEWLNQYRWFAVPHKDTYYAARYEQINGQNEMIFMHDMVAGKMAADECPECDGELVEMNYTEIKVKERSACPFWDSVEPEGEICRANGGLPCPEEGPIWPDCCPLLNSDGVLVEVDKE